MKYALSNCKVTQHYEPYHTYTYTGPCMITGELYSVTVKGEDLYKYRKGALIQEAFPTLSPSDREFLLTGVSPKGWKELYFEEEEAIANDMLNAPWRCASSEGY